MLGIGVRVRVALLIFWQNLHRLMGVRCRLSVRSVYALLGVLALVTATALYFLALGSTTSRKPLSIYQLPAHWMLTTETPWVLSRSSEGGVSPSPDTTPDATPDEWLLDSPPLIDVAPPSRAALLASLQDAAPSLPVAFWLAYDNAYWKKRAFNCTKLPNIHDLHFSNTYWQVLRSSNGTFHLFGAYMDIRKEDAPVVRVLAMIDRMNPIEVHCQLWYEKELDPVVTRVSEYRYIWRRYWGNAEDKIYQPYLFSCPVPKERENNPAAVSIVESPCDRGTNILRVIFNQPEKKKNFAVCVKGLDFYHVDLSVRLVEWIELLVLLGADKIVFYKLNIHPNIFKVLQYYEKQGLVQIWPITLPAEEPNLPILQHDFLLEKIRDKRQNELIPYNDCFYKNLYSYRYITLLDIDEVIMPVYDNSWIELMMKLDGRSVKWKKKIPSFYSVRNVYFLDDLKHKHSFLKDIPQYMHMLQHIYRSKNFTDKWAYIKGFHNPRSVVTIHNHFPFSCFGKCDVFHVNLHVAQLHHYRQDCVNDLKDSCDQFRNNSIIDTTIWKYKQTLIRNTGRVLIKLGFIAPSVAGTKIDYI